MNRYEFATVDVFTTQRFGGNPLAVVLAADGLESSQMQALAAEFNYSETTFVLRPDDPSHTARVRIFNRRNEMDFAGHPNVGTALVLARLRDRGPDSPGAHAAARDGTAGTAGERPRPPVGVADHFTFEERAGLVVVEIERDADGRPAQARVNAPQALSVRATLPVEGVADCLGLDVTDVATDVHPPVVASVGTTFGLVRVRGDALERISTRLDAFAALAARFPELGGRMSVFVYRDRADRADRHVEARMFAPLDGTAEDPATGSAAAALAAYRLSLTAEKTLRMRVTQGVRMGRASLIEARAWRDGGCRASVSGGCVEVFRGTFAA